MKTTILVSSLITVMSLAIGSEADAGKKKAKAKEAFTQMDTDADGKLSLEEFVAGGSEENAARRTEAFATIDADADGSVTKEEFKAAKKAKKGKKGETEETSQTSQE